MGEKERQEILCQLKRTSSQSWGGGTRRAEGGAGEMGSHQERVQDKTSERGWVQNELERQAGVQLKQMGTAERMWWYWGSAAAKNWNS